MHTPAQAAYDVGSMCATRAIRLPLRSEADKQEEMQDSAADEGGEDGIDQRSAAVITINALGLIQSVNKVRAVRAHGTWGGTSCMRRRRRSTPAALT